jgi:hypothetical protein
MKVLGWLTHSVKKIITLDFVSGNNFFPRLFIYPNTFIQGQYVYINIYGHNIQVMFYIHANPVGSVFPYLRNYVH